MTSKITILLFIMCGATMAKLRCGNDGIQHGLAQNILQNDCKGRLGRIDACCVAHTQCYKQKAPQKVCDDTFCSCIEQAASSMPLCTFHANNFCATARTFGGLQYNKPR